MLLYQILTSTIHGKKIKKSNKNNKFEILTPTWKDKFQLTDGSYSDHIVMDHILRFL